MFSSKHQAVSGKNYPMTTKDMIINKLTNLYINDLLLQADTCGLYVVPKLSVLNF